MEKMKKKKKRSVSCTLTPVLVFSFNIDYQIVFNSFSFFSSSYSSLFSCEAKGKSVWPIAEQDYLIRWLFRSLVFFLLALLRLLLLLLLIFSSMTMMSLVRIHTSSLPSDPIFLLLQLLLLSEHILFMVFFFLRFTNRTMPDREKSPCYWIIEQEDDENDDDDEEAAAEEGEKQELTIEKNDDEECRENKTSKFYSIWCMRVRAYVGVRFSNEKTTQVMIWSPLIRICYCVSDKLTRTDEEKKKAHTHRHQDFFRSCERKKQQ